MRNLYTCENCIFNPAQYQDVGAKTGYCLQYDSLLFNPSTTTCRFFRRKDLPYFVSEEGHKEHRHEFNDTRGIVDYYSKLPVEHRKYSAKFAWENNSFDPYLHEVAVYHRSEKKWVFLQAFLASRNPVKNMIQSCLVRRYVYQCGPQRDNYNIILSATVDLGEQLDLKIQDFRVQLEDDEFRQLREGYLKDILLIRLYAVQEYGALVGNEKIMWASDELNGAIESSWNEFAGAVKRLVPWLQQVIIRSARARGTFYPDPTEKSE